MRVNGGHGLTGDGWIIHYGNMSSVECDVSRDHSRVKWNTETVTRSRHSTRRWEGHPYPFLPFYCPVYQLYSFYLISFLSLCQSSYRLIEGILNSFVIQLFSRVSYDRHFSYRTLDRFHPSPIFEMLRHFSPVSSPLFKFRVSLAILRDALRLFPVPWC